MSTLFSRLALAVLLVGASVYAAVPALQPLRIVSYNIHEGMKTDTSPAKEALVAWVKKVQPDVLALLEAQQFTPASLEQLARRYGHAHAVLLKEDGYPIALTSRFPMTGVEKVTKDMHHGYLKASIAGYSIIATHLSPYTYHKRRDEVERLLGVVRSAPAAERWIILGDFNSMSRVDAKRHEHGRVAAGEMRVQQKYPIRDNLIDGKLDYTVIDRMLEAGFVDVIDRHVPAPPPTRPSKDFIAHGAIAVPARIDFIFASANVDTIVDAGVLIDEFTDVHSDHYPVWVTLAN